ncbi:MAG: hypothetical protein WCJ58_01165 [bacterium]
MLNKIKKLIAAAKFNRAQDKRFAGVLDQNFELEDDAGILRTSILVGIIAAACFWLIVIGLDAQASKLDKKLEQQEFYNIIKTTYNQ